MQNLRENAMVLCRNRRKGVSLVIAMCASFLIFISAFGVIFSVSVLLKSSRDDLTRERCRQLALSFADVLQAELVENEGSFCGHVEAVLGGSTDISRTMATGEEGYGTLIVSVVRTQRLDPELPGGSFSYGETEAALEDIQKENCFPCTAFVIETRAELEGESYTCKDPYLQLVRFQPLFFVDGSPVYWAEGWFWDEEGTLPLEEGAAVIDYSYDPGQPLDRFFVLGWEEGGSL